MYTIENNSMEFVWNRDRLFEVASARSIYYAQSAAVASEGDPFDRVALTEDEREFVSQTLRLAGNDLYDLVRAILYPGVIPSLPSAENEWKVGGFVVTYHGSAADVNVDRVASFDLDCEEFLVYRVLERRAETVGEEALRTLFVRERERLAERVRAAMPYFVKSRLTKSYSQQYK